MPRIKNTRKRAEEALRELWDKRAVAHIPPAELRRLSDDSVTDLVRFWTHQNTHWDDINAPTYSSPRDAKPVPAGTGHLIRAVVGKLRPDALTPRQRVALGRISSES